MPVQSMFLQESAAKNLTYCYRVFPSEGAMIAAERIRKSIEHVEIETIGHITGSLGVANIL